MQLFIQSNGATFTLNVAEGATVEQLKAAVEDKEFIPSSLQRLVTGTTTLTAGLLSEFGVEEESTVQLLMDINGGMRAKWRKKRMRRLRRKRRKMRMRAR